MTYQKNVLIPDLPFEAYSKVDALNASLIKKIHKSPAHAKAYLDKLETEDEDSEALLFGSAFHAALLEPQRFKEFLKVSPKADRRTTAGKAIAAEFEASLIEGDIVVKESWLEQITGMLLSIKNHPLANPLLTNGVRENCLFWDDPETGVPCKARFDFISHEGIPIDIKTARDAQPDRASREIFSDDRLYWLQAGHYVSGAKVTNVCCHDSFTFIFIEKTPPYALSVKIMEGPDLDASMDHRNRLVRKYKKSMESGIWESYPPEPTIATVGDWFMQKYSKDAI